MISAPACYGKLPAYGDFYQHRAAGPPTNDWWRWFAQNTEYCDFSPSTTPPWCFLLPPGFMSWSGKKIVMGVLAGSRDRVGRDYPLVIWQTADPRRLFAFWKEAGSSTPDHDWLFWLSRLAGAVSRHEDGIASLVPGKSFGERLDDLWRIFRPGWRELLRLGKRRILSRDSLEMLTGGMRNETRHGVRHLPWPDWPDRLAVTGATACFWTMDGRGRFLEAVTGKRPDAELLARLFTKNKTAS